MIHGYGRVAGLLGILWLWMCPAVAAETHVLQGPSSGAIPVLDRRDVRPAVVVGGPPWFGLSFDNSRPLLRPLTGYTPAPGPDLPADGLPMSRVAAGSRDIERVWLSTPTLRYPHGVLGDRYEAAALSAIDRGGRRHRLDLPINTVFEDLVPRLADLGEPARDAVLVVRSSLESGAALVAYRLGNAGFEEIATTPAIGSPSRWLNPIGAADFDGDGRPDVALVWHPHIGGILKIYSFESGRFVETGSLPGVSNHDIGSTRLELHAVGDFDGDGIADLAVRAADRRRILVLSFARRNLRTIATYAHESPVAGPLVAADLDGNGRDDLVYTLADGLVIAVRH